MINFMSLLLTTGRQRDRGEQQQKPISCNFRSSPATYTGGEGVLLTMAVGHCNMHDILGEDWAGTHLRGRCWLGRHYWHVVMPPMTRSEPTNIVVATPVLATSAATYTGVGFSVLLIVWLGSVCRCLGWLSVGALTGVTDSPWLPVPHL